MVSCMSARGWYSSAQQRPSLARLSANGAVCCLRVRGARYGRADWRRVRDKASPPSARVASSAVAGSGTLAFGTV